jgi:hypothetical protein
MDTITSELEQIYQRQREDAERLNRLLAQAPDGVERVAVIEVRRTAIAATNKTAQTLQQVRARVGRR